MDDLVVDNLVMVDMDNDAKFIDMDDVVFDDLVNIEIPTEHAATGDLKGLNELTRTSIIPYVVVPIFIFGAVAFFATRKFLKLEKKHSKLEIDMGDVDAHKSGYYDVEMQEPIDCERDNHDEVNQHTSVEDGRRIIPSSSRQCILSQADAWRRAKHFFPNLVIGNEVLHRRELPEDRLEFLLHKRVDELKKSGKLKTLSEPGNAIDLCVALGMEENYVRKRYEVVARLREAFGLKSKTTTIDTVLHLIGSIGCKNPFVNNVNFLNGQKWSHDDYGWLNYRGYVVKRGNIRQLLSQVKNNLSADNDDDLYVHGTNGSNLVDMAESAGYMRASKNTNSYRNDFGGGVYCFKGWSKALSFAVDRCWPLRDEQGKFESNNPCLVMFPDCKLKDDDFYDVIGSQPNTAILRADQKGEYEEFQRSLKGAKDKRFTNWKEFMKRSLYFNKRPLHLTGFRGYLHDCNPTSIANTTFDLTSVPEIDKDRWIQYCPWI